MLRCLEGTPLLELFSQTDLQVVYMSQAFRDQIREQRVDYLPRGCTVIRVQRPITVDDFIRYRGGLLSIGVSFEELFNALRCSMTISLQDDSRTISCFIRNGECVTKIDAVWVRGITIPIGSLWTDDNTSYSELQLTKSGWRLYAVTLSNAVNQIQPDDWVLV